MDCRRPVLSDVPVQCKVIDGQTKDEEMDWDLEVDGLEDVSRREGKGMGGIGGGILEGRAKGEKVSKVEEIDDEGRKDGDEERDFGEGDLRGYHSSVSAQF